MATKKPPTNSKVQVLRASPSELFSTLRESILSLPDLTNRGQLLDFVDNYDVSRIQTFEDLAIGFNGLFRMAVVLGYRDPQVLKCVEIANKVLGNYAQWQARYLEIEFPKKIEERIKGQMADLMSSLERMLPPETWDTVKGILEHERSDEET